MGVEVGSSLGCIWWGASDLVGGGEGRRQSEQAEGVGGVAAPPGVGWGGVGAVGIGRAARFQQQPQPPAYRVHVVMANTPVPRAALQVGHVDTIAKRGNQPKEMRWEKDGERRTQTDVEKDAGFAGGKSRTVDPTNTKASIEAMVRLTTRGSVMAMLETHVDGKRTKSTWYVTKLDRVAQRLEQTLREEGPRNGQALAILLEHVFDRIEQVYKDEKVRS